MKAAVRAGQPEIRHVQETCHCGKRHRFDEASRRAHPAAHSEGSEGAPRPVLVARLHAALRIERVGTLVEAVREMARHGTHVTGRADGNVEPGELERSLDGERERELDRVQSKRLGQSRAQGFVAVV